MVMIWDIIIIYLHIIGSVLVWYPRGVELERMMVKGNRSGEVGSNRCISIKNFSLEKF